MSEEITIDKLFKEIEHITNVMQYEERQGEQRVRFFLSMVVGSIGLLAFLQKGDALGDIHVATVIEIVLVILLCYGGHTLNRLNWTKIYLDSSSERVRLVYEALLKIEKHFTVKADWWNAIDCRKGFLRKIRGSASEFMYMTNSFLVGGFVLTVAIDCCWASPWQVIVPLVFLFGSVFVQYISCHKYRNHVLGRN